MAKASFTAAATPQGFRPVSITLTLESADELKGLFALANWSPTAQVFGQAGAKTIRDACRAAGFAPVLRKTETGWLRELIRDRLARDRETL